MTKKTMVVTPSRRPSARIPDTFAEGAALVTLLSERGFFREVIERLKVDRGSGYTGVDAVLFLILYFAATAQLGFSTFDERVNGCRVRLAALADRRTLATQSSMSRVLGDVDQSMVRGLCTWFLEEATGAIELLRHPSVLSLDALGQPWHVLHYDPTKTVLRQRALPTGGDLAPAHRRAATLAAPGYTGRKRGEVVVLRPTLQHAGSSLWLHMSLAPGNGNQREALRQACAAAAACGDRLGHPRSRLLFVADGEFGHVPGYAEIRAAGMAAITRLNRPELLDQEDIREHMATNPWYFVPDSGSGPRRSAMDLGVVTVRPGKETVQDDGTPYEPTAVRVVVSRYPREGKANHGRVIDGWQYELFVAMDVPPEAWSAPDVIATFYQRSGQENRFRQEDRELCLDRILSYHLGGQELANLIGLTVWNLRVMLGFQMNPLPATRVSASPRAMEVDLRPVPTSDTRASSDQATTLDASAVPTSCSAAPDANGLSAEPGPPRVDELDAEGLTEAPPTEASELDEPRDAVAALTAALAKEDWEHILARRPGWSFDRSWGALRCPAGQLLTLCCVSPGCASGSAPFMFRASAGACTGCLLRDGCLASVRPTAVKLTSVAVPSTTADAIQPLMDAVHRQRRHERSVKAEAKKTPPADIRPSNSPTKSSDTPPTTAPPAARLKSPSREEPFPVILATSDTAVGPWAISDPQLLPAAARAAFRAACGQLEVRIQVQIPRPKPQHPYLVTSPARRQHRRATWAERHARYALPEDAELQVLIEGAAALHRLLPTDMTSALAAA